MPMDMYGDSDEGTPASPMPEQSEQKSPEDSNSSTAVLPKSILMGKDFKPGDEVVLKIVKMHEDSVEVEYATEKGAEEEKEQSGDMTASPEPAGNVSGSSMYGDN